MYLKVYLLLASIILFTSSCAFTPRVSEEQEYTENCKMLTKNLTLSVTHLKGKKCSSDGDIHFCLMAFGVVIPAGSFLVSGSVVLAGKTLHWLEYQGFCEDGFIQKNIKRLKKNTARLKKKIGS